MADDTKGWTLVEEVAPPQMAVSHEGTKGGGTLAIAGQSIPIIADAAAEFGTNPNVPRAAATAGRVIGGVTSLPAGLTGLGDVQKGAWAGSRSGWFTGKMLQDMARPVSTLLDKVAPVAHAVSQLGAVQGALDLNQMAEPNRRDIGFLGIGSSIGDMDVLKAAVKNGANPTQAAAQLAKGDPSRFAQLVTAYSQALRQGQ